MKALHACAALVIALTVAASDLRAASDPQATVREFYATLLDVMKRGPALRSKGRYEALAPAIHRSFDLTYMARLAVGPGWSKLSPEEQKRVTEAFERYTNATYADRFDSYSGEKFEVTGLRETAAGPIVRSRLVQSNGKPVELDYLMHKKGEGWQIADVYLDGTVSQLASLRSQFGAVLAREGVDGLIAALDRKTDTIVAKSS
jgi:phospholipid transport system substrate-binding protein